MCMAHCALLSSAWASHQNRYDCYSHGQRRLELPRRALHPLLTVGLTWGEGRGGIPDQADLLVCRLVLPSIVAYVEI